MTSEKLADWWNRLIHKLEEKQNAFSFTFRPSYLILIITFLLYVCIRVGWALYGYGVLSGGSGCQLQNASHPQLESHIYDFAMKHTMPHGEAKRVAQVTLTNGTEPLRVFTNTCENRRFLTYVIRELKTQHVGVIAIDQSYSEDSCNDEDINKAFTAALEQPEIPKEDRIPVVVGQSVHGRDDGTNGDDCLIAESTFDFRKRVQDAARAFEENVKYGLLSFNSNLRKIPLFWYVFPSDDSATGKSDAPENGKTFGFAYQAALAATRDDQSVFRDSQLDGFLKNNEHPYTSFVRDIPRWNAMDLLCYGPDKLASQYQDAVDKNSAEKHSINCGSVPHTPFKLNGKVVVIGERISTDRVNLGNWSAYGMELHAEYIEALLDKRYIAEAPKWLDWGFIILFVVVAVVMDISTSEGYKMSLFLLVRRELYLLLGLILVSILILIFFHRFMPTFYLTVVPLSSTLISGLLVAFSIQKKVEASQQADTNQHKDAS